MFLHTSSNLFELSVVYSFNMSANMNLANPVYSSSPISLFIILSTGLFSIVKAYSTGIDVYKRQAFTHSKPSHELSISYIALLRLYR